MDEAAGRPADLRESSGLAGARLERDARASVTAGAGVGSGPRRSALDPTSTAMARMAEAATTVTIVSARRGKGTRIREA
jgi:hypothetical protein